MKKQEDALTQAWAVAKSLQAQVDLLESAIHEITSNYYENAYAIARAALLELKLHRES